MAHKIELEDLALGTVQRDAMQPVSWHGLEIPVAGLTTQNSALRTLPIEIVKPIFTLANGTSYAGQYEQAVTVHPTEESGLLFVSAPYNPETYKLLTPRDLLDLCEQCFSAAGLDNTLAFTTTLFAGRRTTISKALPDCGFTDARGHKVNAYLSIMDSMDSTWSLGAYISEIRTVCYNTATANIGNGGLTQKHNREAMEMFLLNFPHILAEAINGHKTSAGDYLRMSSFAMSSAQCEGFAASLIGKGKLSARGRNVVTEIVRLFNRGRGNLGEHRADAYNGVTEYFTHKGSAEANAPDGTSDNYKRRAKEMLLSDNLPELIANGQKAVRDYEQIAVTA